MTPISTRSREERSLTELYADHEHLADPAITDRAWAQATREVRSAGRVWRGPPAGSPPLPWSELLASEPGLWR